MNIGSLYRIKQLYWLLFPSQEKAVAAALVFGTPQASLTDVRDRADYWGKKLKCNFSFLSPESIFAPLEQKNKVLKVLTTNGEIGWMIYPEKEIWTNGCIEEVVNPLTSS